MEFHAGDQGYASAYSYSHSRGLYAGASLDGAFIFSRSTVNHQFYGREVTPTEVLSGEIAPPRAASPLYSALTDMVSCSPDLRYLRPVLIKRLLPTSSSVPVPESTDPFNVYREYDERFSSVLGYQALSRERNEKEEETSQLLSPLNTQHSTTASQGQLQQYPQASGRPLSSKNQYLDLDSVIIMPVGEVKSSDDGIFPSYQNT